MKNDQFPAEIATHPMGARDDRDGVFPAAILGLDEAIERQAEEAYNSQEGVKAMKKMGIMLGALLFLATFGFGAEKTFSLLVSGGMTHVAPHDLNSFLQDYARYYLHPVDPSYYIVTSDNQNLVTKELKYSSELELTLLVRVAPRIFLTFGSGLVSAGLESDPLIQSYSDLEVRLSRNDRIKSIPIRVGLLYSWPLSDRLSLRPHISLDAYLSSFKETGYDETKGLGDYPFLARDEWDIRTTAFSWGSTWGLSLDLGLSATVDLSLDGGYRRARLGSFRGTEVRFDNGVIESEGDFRLLYYEFYADWLKTGYNFLNLPMASGSTQLDIVRDAVLDLSGPYLKAGLRISF
jgi:hypothetical protein